MKMQTSALALVVACVASGCATGPDRKPGDPLEPMNRAVFKFNDSLDTYVAQPIAKGYEKVTPSPLRTAISNFFSNLGDLGNAANNLMQLHITDATEDVMRFAFNSTFGIFGLLDFATPAGLPKHHQDFGLTLGRWGVPSGPYLVLPLFGPSSFRDSVGFAVDFRFNPLNYAEPAVRNPLYGLQFVSKRADLLGATDLLSQAALDKYSFVRDAYTQQRISLLRAAGAVGTSPAALPDYGEPDDSSAAPTSGASGTAPGGVPAGAPDYTDPGEGAAGPATPPAPASGTQPTAPSDVPNYTDPGETPASGTSDSTPTPPAGDKAPEVSPLPKPAVQ
ncbi:MAG: VacJ family lipoprotein [Paraburkholderia sp.]|uniref:MlaA family lipoprotein n=1 Tax=Paraburkholderia sp. TaxID=1926495 RepID=UPI0011F46F1A|nr:VacJ family lipoprotein [Paraburkholderia sp.]TAL99146.1 MAG: VacJ family lipoprotein [Paraburkholderia sp.]